MVYNRTCYPNRTYYRKSGETEGSESGKNPEPERYAVEARIFDIGIVVTKVRPAEPRERKTRRLETRESVIWIDVFDSREEAEEFRLQYHDPWEGKEKHDYEGD